MYFLSENILKLTVLFNVLYPQPTARYRSLRPLRICANLGVVVGKREVRFAAVSRAGFRRRCSVLRTERLYRLRRQSPDCLRLAGSSQRARREGSNQLAADEMPIGLRPTGSLKLSLESLTSLRLVSG